MFAEFVRQSAVAPGSATTINLVAPTTGYRSFASAFPGSMVCGYYIRDRATNQWERGTGVAAAGSPDTLTRTTVLSNSLGTTARINFTGTVEVYSQLFPPTATGAELMLAASRAAARAAIDARSVYAADAPTTSGSAVAFTGIPAAVTWIELILSGVRTAAAAQVLVELGHGGGPTYVTTGYNGSIVIIESTITPQGAVVTAGFPLLTTGAARFGALTLRRAQAGSNQWFARGQIYLDTAAAVGLTTGVVTLPAEITALRLTTGSSFNLGAARIAWGF